MNWLLTIALCWLTILALGWTAAALIMRRANTRFGLIIMVLRGLTMLATAVLTWKVIKGLGLLDAPRTDRKTADHIVVLQDKSLSMDFLARDTMTRNDLADSTWNDCAAAIGSGKTKLTRMYFGRNLVTPDNEAGLDRSSSMLSSAVREILGRERLKSILVISDGASSDGAGVERFLKWTKNKNAKVYSILAATPGRQFIDYSIGSAECDTMNPAVISASVRCRNTGNISTAVMLHIDEKKIETLLILPQREQTVVFDVPSDLKSGRHTYRIEIAPVQGELTGLNNSYCGTFKTRAPTRAIFITERLDRNNLFIARQLLNEYPEDIKTVTVNSEALNQLDLGQITTVIIGDVSPDKLPPAILNNIRSGNCNLLMLSGNNMQAWCNKNIPRFPIKKAGRWINLSEDGKNPAKAEITAEAKSQITTRAGATGNLAVNFVQEAEENSQCARLMIATAGNQRFPLIVADSYTNARTTVILCRETWKWAMDPDAETRLECQAIFDALLAGVMEDKIKPHNLQGNAASLTNPPGQELAVINCIPETLQQLSRTQDRFAWYPDRRRIIRAMQADVAEENNEIRKSHKRDTKTEIMILLFLVILLGIEWTVERHLNKLAT